MRAHFVPETHGSEPEKGRNEPIVGKEWRTSVLMEVNVTVPPRRTSRPRATCAPLPGLQARGEQGSEALRPRRRRLMGEREAPGEECLSDGAQAQRVLRTPEDTSRGEGDPGWSLVCSPCPDTVAVSTVHAACDDHWDTDGRGVTPGHTQRAGRPHASPPCVRRCGKMLVYFVAVQVP